MRINCNISALIANNSLTKGQTALDKSIERLSSGLRINHAKDDAAGMAIAKKMHTQIKAVGQASNNSSDGIYVVQTAEGALGEVENMLQRARELAVQAADGSYGDDDREAIQKEIDQILNEVDRISTDTEYNTMPLLDGTLSRRCYSDIDDVSVISTTNKVAAGDYKINVTSPATRATATINKFAGTVTADQAGSVNINGADITIDAGDTFDDIYDKIIAGCNVVNVDVDNSSGNIDLTNKAYGEKNELTVKFDSDKVAALFGMAKETTSAGKDCEASLGDGFAGTASLRTDGKVITIKDVNNFEMKVEVSGDTTFNNGNVKVTDIGIMCIQAGANEGEQIEIDIPRTDTHTLEINDINVSTAKGAGIALDKLDKAISQVSAVRSKLGAYQNRLEATVTSLDEYNVNITSALSGIEDCDMADEMTEYTAQSVIAQAATSVLAQANERPQTILQLLQ